MKKIKLGSIVKTSKGDRCRSDAKEEELLVVKKGKEREVAGVMEPVFICEKPDGRHGAFLAKNLYLV